MDIKILVASHKKYHMPSDPVYYPVWCGAYTQAPEKTVGFSRDDTGENISRKNPYFCELTGLYWAWKNLHYDYLGLVHYRRYFEQRRTGERDNRILQGENLPYLLAKAPVILPKKRHYWIDTNYGQYIHAHHEQDLIQTRIIISQIYPKYISAFDWEMKRTSGHRFNMFIMRRDFLDAYCSWLFHILFELEQQLDISQYSKNDQRVFGFVAERLMDCWMNTNRVPYVEKPILNLESQHWLKKGTAFVERRFAGQRSGQ